MIKTAILLQRIQHTKTEDTTHQKSIKNTLLSIEKPINKCLMRDTPKWSINMLIKRDFHDQDVLKKGW